MRARTQIGIVSGFAALLTTTLGGGAIAATHPSAGSFVVSADASRAIGDIKLGLQPAKDAARLAGYARFEHAALAALTAKADDVAGEISAASAKNAPAKLLDKAGVARSAALAALAAAKASLESADAALAAGDNADGEAALRETGGHLRDAALHLGVARWLAGAAMHAAFLADKAAELAAAKANVANADVKPFAFDPTDAGHHCDGGFGGSGSGAGFDGYHHDRFHHDYWHH